MKSCLEDNDIKMYSTPHEEKSVAAERFVQTSKSKLYKYMTSVSKNMYIDKLDDIVNKYNNPYHNAIKMKPVDVKSNTYIDFNSKNNEEDPKFVIGDHRWISKYKNILAKGDTPNWSENIFMIKKVKNTVPWAYVIINLNGEEIVQRFYEK